MGSICNGGIVCAFSLIGVASLFGGYVFSISTNMLNVCDGRMVFTF